MNTESTFPRPAVVLDPVSSEHRPHMEHILFRDAVAKPDLCEDVVHNGL